MAKASGAEVQDVAGKGMKTRKPQGRLKRLRRFANVRLGQARVCELAEGTKGTRPGEDSVAPALAVEAAVLNGLGDVLRADAGLAVEVGDGAGELDDAVVGAGGEAEALHGHFEQFGAGVVEDAEFLEEGRGHLGVAVDAGVGGEPLVLDGPGGDDAGLDGGAGLAVGGGGEFVELDGDDLGVDVYAVEEGTGDFGQVFPDGSGGAGAFLGGVVVVAAGAGVHGGDEHDVGGVFHGEA